MKKNTPILFLSIFASFLVTISACTKTNETEAETDYTAMFSFQADEQTFFSTEDEAVTNDVNSVLEADSTFTNRTSVICDANIVAKSTATARTITITFKGDSCNANRVRKGVAIVTLPLNKKWEDAGASVSVSYQNLKITRSRDKKSMVLNGTKTITNVSGGLLKDLAIIRSVIHTVTSNALNITFPDSTRRDWQISKKREFSYQNGIVIRTTGTHAEGTTNNIAEWGINRFGKEFTCQITQPLVIRQDCSFRLVSGKIVYSKLEKPISVTFGLNAQGVATSCPGPGFYYSKMEWLSLQGLLLSVLLRY